MSVAPELPADAERAALLRELARCYARAAVDEMLREAAESSTTNTELHSDVSTDK